MSLSAEKVAEALALPVSDRAFLAHELIASLDEQADPDAERGWNEELDLRDSEIAEGRVTLIPHDQVISRIRARLHAHRNAS